MDEQRDVNSMGKEALRQEVLRWRAAPRVDSDGQREQARGNNSLLDHSVRKVMDDNEQLRYEKSEWLKERAEFLKDYELVQNILDGKVQVLTDPNVTAIEVRNSEQYYGEMFADEREISGIFSTLLINLSGALASVQTAGTCGYHKRTRHVLTTANAQLLANLDIIDTKLEIHRKQLHENDILMFESILTGSKALWARVKDFNGAPSISALADLRAYLTHANPKITDLIVGVTTNGTVGRPRAKDEWLTGELKRRMTNDGLSDLAAAEQLLTDLQTIPYDKLTKGQKQALATLLRSKDWERALDRRLT